MSLKLQGLTKSYASNRVLDGVDLEIRAGSVHALLGPNGAGKSTLIKCLGGVTAPDAGSMELDGEEFRNLTPSLAIERGIATIHQHLSLIGSLSVTDNIFLGSEQSRWGLLKSRQQRAETLALLERFNIRVAPGTRVDELPIGVRQLIEIAKAWHRRDVKLLILDEPTAALSGPETERLFREIENMRNEGASILYTTHRLSEVFEIADDVTVLRDGRVELQSSRRDVSPQQLVGAISPGTVQYQKDADREPDGAVVAEVRDLAGPRFGPVSFQLSKGEVLGLFGSVGSGRTSLLETLAGAFKPTAGATFVEDRQLPPGSVPHARQRGVLLVASDRAGQSLWGSLSARDNLLTPSASRRGPVRRFAQEKQAFGRVADRLQLRPNAPDLPAENFSGGNQQKLVVGRLSIEMERAKLLILDEPTQGVDVGARAQIYAEIRRLVDESGCAAIVASAEADEIVALADRAIVMDDGAIVAELRGAYLTESALISAAHQFVGQDQE